jgi:hypothetical protein
MDRYRRRIAMLSVGAQLGCPVRRRNVAAAPRLGDVEVLQVAGQVRGPGGGMQDQVRQPGQVIFLFGDESVHRRGRVVQRRPGSLGDPGVSTAR